MGLFSVPEGFPLDYVNELASGSRGRKSVKCTLPDIYLPSSGAKDLFKS